MSDFVVWAADVGSIPNASVLMRLHAESQRGCPTGAELLLALSVPCSFLWPMPGILVLSQGREQGSRIEPGVPVAAPML
jgi:hypothetical protein